MFLTELHTKVRWRKRWLVCATWLINQSVSSKMEGTQRAFVLWFGLFCCTSECVSVIALWVWALERHHLLQISASYRLSPVGSLCVILSENVQALLLCCVKEEKRCALNNCKGEMEQVGVKNFCRWIRGCLHKQEDCVLQADTQKKITWVNITKLLYGLWFLKSFC